MITKKSKKIEKLVDDLLRRAILGVGDKNKVGYLTSHYLTKEEKKLLKLIKSEDFNRRIK